MSSSVSSCTVAATLAVRLAPVFSKTAGLWAAVRLEDARRHTGTLDGGMGDAIRGRRDAVDAPEAGRERADAAQAHRQADVRHRPVGVAQHRRGALEPAREQVLMRCLAESAPELAA